ncbi:hypothetical protein THIOM_002914 [Candidatus Thiomargarita nelsonii]|uniref:Uncharacterized protein n=1 Tax=Candidatus Thiomargarita nelsonii TaxID=1003181 RepID=A0A176RZU0_9GAMM|nr:hypothetical protein THIOM_002914 [Candidatus Thiomargarita nelsonii]
MGAVEDNIFSRNTEPTRFIIFHFRHHFGDTFLLVVDSVDGIEIVGFIGPAEGHIGIAGGKGFFGLSDGVANLFFRKDKQR